MLHFRCCSIELLAKCSSTVWIDGIDRISLYISESIQTLRQSHRAEKGISVQKPTGAWRVEPRMHVIEILCRGQAEIPLMSGELHPLVVESATRCFLAKWPVRVL